MKPPGGEIGRRWAANFADFTRRSRHWGGLGGRSPPLEFRGGVGGGEAHPTNVVHARGASGESPDKLEMSPLPPITAGFPFYSRPHVPLQSSSSAKAAGVTPRCATTFRTGFGVLRSMPGGGFQNSPRKFYSSARQPWVTGRRCGPKFCHLSCQ